MRQWRRRKARLKTAARDAKAQDTVRAAVTKEVASGNSATVSGARRLLVWAMANPGDRVVLVVRPRERKLHVEVLRQVAKAMGLPAPTWSNTMLRWPNGARAFYYSVSGVDPGARVKTWVDEARSIRP